jgi:hypothetical protein
MPYGALAVLVSSKTGAADVIAHNRSASGKINPRNVLLESAT